MAQMSGDGFLQGRRIHFAGVGGVGMSALAVLAKACGAEVTGCDISATSRTRWLESMGVKVSVGHDASHLLGVDELVVTPAVSPDNPELAYCASAEGRRIRVRRRGELLAEMVSSCSSIAVCGSHGKTTTATFTARLLLALGEDVSWAIGGETGDFPVAGVAKGGLFSDGAVLVVEADESDGTLALYHPDVLVVTNCEYDHPDHFKTPSDYFACFDAARRNSGDVVEAESLPLDGWDSLGSLPLHNQRNARAAAEVALRRGHSKAAIERALASIVEELPDRRFQTIAANTPAGTVVTDYAHHPTEMKCAVAMARDVCRGRLRVLFQPHRYSRTKALINDFPEALRGADEVVLCPTYAAFERPVEGGDIADLYAACRRAWKGAPRLFLARSCREAWRHAYFEGREDDVTLLLGAGDIIGLADDVVADCSAAGARPAGPGTDLSGFSFFRTGGRSVGGGVRHVVGMGSNLWISDLTTDEEYTRLGHGGAESRRPTPSGRVVFPAGAPGAVLGVPWMAGVPGSVGGWIVMNAGAFSHSIGELVMRVKVDGRWLARGECGFGYRTSAIKGVVEEVEFAFPESWDVDAAACLAKRPHFPPRCCGSVFKNPPGDFAGRLLEAVGAKGLSVGGAYVWEGHANVIAARDGATSSDILALARIMRERVFHRYGVRLSAEIRGLDV